MIDALCFIPTYAIGPPQKWRSNLHSKLHGSVQAGVVRSEARYLFAYDFGWNIQVPAFLKLPYTTIFPP